MNQEGKALRRGSCLEELLPQKGRARWGWNPDLDDAGVLRTIVLAGRGRRRWQPELTAGRNNQNFGSGEVHLGDTSWDSRHIGGGISLFCLSPVAFRSLAVSR